MSDYRPIPCAAYDGFEIAILHGGKLRVRWRDEVGSAHEETLTPLHLQIKDRAEHLLARRADGAPIEIRLDRIEKSAPID